MPRQDELHLSTSDPSVLGIVPNKEFARAVFLFPRRLCVCAMELPRNFESPLPIPRKSLKQDGANLAAKPPILCGNTETLSVIHEKLISNRQLCCLLILLAQTEFYKRVLPKLANVLKSLSALH